MKRLPLVLVALVLLAGTLFAQSTTTGNQRVIPTYQLTITSNIRGAQVTINGEPQRGSTPLTVTLRRGTYDIRVEARGYLTFAQTIVLNADTAIRAELRPPFATIVRNVPQEYLNYDIRNPASVVYLYVNGQQRNENRVQVNEGWHDIAIVSGGLRIESEFYLEAGTTYTLELILRMGILQSF